MFLLATNIKKWRYKKKTDQIWVTYKATEFQIEIVTDEPELLSNALFQYTALKVWNRLGSEFWHKPWCWGMSIIGTHHMIISFKYQKVLLHVHNSLQCNKNNYN